MRLTFSQEQGISPIPAQADLGTVSDHTRASLWAFYHAHLTAHSPNFPSSDLGLMLRGWWVHVLHKKIDEAPDQQFRWKAPVKDALYSNYAKVFDLVQFCIQQRGGRYLRDPLAAILKETCAAYRIIDDRVVPFASESEHAQLVAAVEKSTESKAEGARSHLLLAAQDLSSKAWARSVHNSISAVESAARHFSNSPSKGLSDILGELKRTKTLKHPALADGLTKLYAYTSDEQGIRHSLIYENASVDEHDAFLMLGLCAAFVTYLLAMPSQP